MRNRSGRRSTCGRRSNRGRSDYRCPRNQRGRAQGPTKGNLPRPCGRREGGDRFHIAFKEFGSQAASRSQVQRLAQFRDGLGPDSGHRPMPPRRSRLGPHLDDTGRKQGPPHQHQTGHQEEAARRPSALPRRITHGPGMLPACNNPPCYVATTLRKDPPFGGDEPVACTATSSAKVIKTWSTYD